MATLVLGTVGALFGPLGSAIGSLVGRTIDGKLFGGGTREGPRLKELAVSTSSYGQPLARHYGAVRVAGTIIWSTDLIEQRSTQGGGKGQPSTASYSYSISLAVLLASRPIDRIGRIWADGNLLRGAGGDLKVGGTLRVHTGHGDQLPDPLLKAQLGAQCPAHRGCAYAVFEDLDLSDFGNRIPALSFEVSAGSGREMVEALFEDRDDAVSATLDFPALHGFSHEGGTRADVLALIDRLVPLVPRGEAGALELVSAASLVGAEPALLGEPARWEDGEFGRESGLGRTRRAETGPALSALRYYDHARDYQPGLQRAEGGRAGPGGEVVFEFPGTLAAADARVLVGNAAARNRLRRDALSWRLAEIDPALGAGAIVRVPGEPGLWQVQAWEWRAGGIELELERYSTLTPMPAAADPGAGWVAPDRLAQGSLLRVFELPWDGSGAPDSRRVHAAVGAPTGRWPGAALHLEQAGALVPTGISTAERAVGGTLAQALGASPALLFEAAATLQVQLYDAGAELYGASLDALAGGANRLLVGREIVQFARADALGDGRWRLAGLLRGRGATEAFALAGHVYGVAVTLLDDRVLALPAQQVASGGALRVAAIGLADTAPVYASLENAGASRRPPVPVHPRCRTAADGALELAWTRRARGGWAWLDEVEQALVEASESYEIGLGPVAAPHVLWRSAVPSLVIAAATRATLGAAHPGAALWVRQSGNYGKSGALLLGPLV